MIIIGKMFKVMFDWTSHNTKSQLPTALYPEDTTMKFKKMANLGRLPLDTLARV
jgi:hypothetical protein